MAATLPVGVPKRFIPLARLGLQQWLNGLAVAMSLVLVGLPLGAILYGAFQTGTPYDAAPGGFTFDNVLTVVRDPSLQRSLGFTFVISALVAFFSVLFGGVLAWLVARTNLPTKQLLENLVTLTNYVPPFVGAVAWIALAAPASGFLNIAWRWLTGSREPLLSIFSFWGIVWTMTLFYIPYGFLYCVGSFRSIDPSLEEAAAVHGGRQWTILRTVTFPLARPALTSAFILIFVLSAEMFSIPGLLGGPVQIHTLPYRILLAVQVYPPRWPVAMACSLILLVTACFGLYLYRRSVREEHRYVTVTGKGYRPRQVDLGRWRWLGAAFGWTYVVLGIVLPFGAILLGSFLPFFTPVLRADMLTLANWHAVWREGLTWVALRNTTVLSVLAPTAVVLLAALLSYLIVRGKISGRGALDYVLTLPVAIPGIVFGIGMIWVYVKTPIYGTLAIILLAFITKFLPQGMRNMSVGLLQIHPELEESSRVHGVDQLRTLWRITLPLLQPTILATWILVFVSAVRELSASVMLYTAKSTTFSVLIWDYLAGGTYQQASVLSVMQVGVVVLLVVVARRVMRFGLARQQLSEQGRG